MNPIQQNLRNMRRKIEKALAYCMCCFVPSKEKRKELRKTLIAKMAQPWKKKLHSRYMTELVPSQGYSQYEYNDLYEYFLQHADGDIDKWHHYFSIYNKHFAKYRGKPVNILEIGVFKGGSLKMWKAFFGKNATIFGVDLDENCKQFEDKGAGIHIFIGDQADKAFLKGLMETLPPIDIFIDDGGHTTNQQITTFLECYDKIADDGVYLCEDLHTNYWPQFIDSSETFVDFAKRHVDYLNAWFFNGPKKYEAMGQIPVFTNITHSVTFYNSIIVFEKERVRMPRREFR